MSRARFAELVEELRRLDCSRARTTIHAMLPRLEDRQRFDVATAGASHAVTCDEGARAIVRHELLASYAPGAGDRVSGERLRPGLARTQPTEEARHLRLVSG